MTLKLKITLLSVIFFLLSVSAVSARSGCCSWHGGVCGCGCCDGTPLSSTCAPYYPGCGGGGYGSNSGSYLEQPSCPVFSTYNSLSGDCECNYGYVASGSSCVSGTTWCSGRLGFGSQYDSISKSCECRYGYVLNSTGTKCVTENEACTSLYGYNSRSGLSGKCECNYGYVWNAGGTKCISETESCQNKYGFNSKASLGGGQCECTYGYAFNKAQTRCITQTAACQELNGLMSQYNSLSQKCECISGYEYNGDTCVSKKRDFDTSSIGNNLDVSPTKLPTKAKKVVLTDIPTVKPTDIGFTTSSSFPVTNSEKVTNGGIYGFFMKIFNLIFKSHQ